MTTTSKVSRLLFAIALAAAGCSRQPGTGQVPPPAGPEGAITDVQDEQGNTVKTKFSSAIALNDANEVIGFAEVGASSSLTATLWTANVSGAVKTTPRRLAPLAGNEFSAGFAIDEAGNAVGQSGKGTQRVAVVWRRGTGTATELPALHPTGNSAAFGASADGALVVGEAQDASGATRAALWTADAQGVFTAAPVALPVNLFVVGGNASPYATANGVARVGADIWVVGQVEDGEGKDHGVVWRSVGGAPFAATDLRSNEVASTALDVSGAGVVVGELETSSGVFAPALWVKDDTRPNEFKRTLLAAEGRAVSVNEQGRIAGWAGATSVATVWDAAGAAAATLFSDAEPSAAYAVNGSQLVVGRHSSLGFVQRLE